MKTLASSFRWLKQQRVLLILVVLSVCAHWLCLVIARFELLPESRAGHFLPEKKSQVVWTPSTQSRALTKAGWESQADPLEIFDPSIIALSNGRGFGARPPRPMPSPARSEQQSVQLPQITDQSAFAENRVPPLPQTTLPQDLAARAEKLPAPALEEMDDTLPPPSDEPPPALELRGTLNHRKLIQPFRLPALTTDTPTKPCVFRIGVDGDGRVRSVILQGDGSGNAEADDKAADALRRCVFAPNNQTPQPIGAGKKPEARELLEWGTAVVSWPAKTESPKNNDEPQKQDR